MVFRVLMGKNISYKHLHINSVYCPNKICGYFNIPGKQESGDS